MSYFESLRGAGDCAKFQINNLSSETHERMKHLLNIVCILAASTGVVFAEVAEPKGRPNFLIIMVDDLSPEQFGLSLIHI